MITIFALAGAAQAAPIIIYNFTPAQPVLQLVSISPANHQEFDKSPGSVTISFNMAIDPNATDLNVFDPYNNPIAGRDPMNRDTSMSSTLPAKLLSGTYRIDWKATCSCQDHTTINGTSYFTVD